MDIFKKNAFINFICQTMFAANCKIIVDLYMSLNIIIYIYALLVFDNFFVLNAEYTARFKHAHYVS